uniref:Uncharacterized protein TCIL3000_9_1280 n=1 Tax=Trypanosoma congolense (strain IL3000) TaxID=1068625 RepID=G0UTL8_TRYCI|nr:unnamed protein product [Trypanosoma congolense IL3000]
MPCDGEPDVVVSFDPEGSVVVGLLYERASPTPWVLLPMISIGVPLKHVLHDLAAGSLSQQELLAKPLADVSDCAGTCVEGVRVARVGHVPARNGAYCLLLQFATCGAAQQMRKLLLHASWVDGAASTPEFVRPTATIRRAEAIASASIPCCDTGGCGEDICLRVLCSVSRGSDGGSSRDLRAPSKCAFGSGTLRSAPLAPLEELCPICHEEIASGRPCVVTMCCHVFHLACLNKHLEDVSSQCPLCRFSMSSLETKCNACGTCQDLWTCLVCGWVGCGQGRHNDGLRHFEDTGHSCAVQNSTSRIWNYRACTFVHHQLAIELGHEDDAKAARAASVEQDATTVCGRPGCTDHKLTASSYWRSRWWWDEKDEEAALEVNSEYVREYYLRVMDQLMQEQARHFEGRFVGKGNNPCVSLEARRKLVSAEQRGRRSIVSDYIAGVRCIVLRDRMLVNRFVKLELLQRKSLYDELVLQSHIIQGLNAQISRVRANIDKAKRRGVQQEAAKEEELVVLRERLDRLLESLE